jgi:recombinational DNA repair protein RecT
MSDATNKMAWLNTLKPQTFMDDPGVEKNFITMNMKIKGVSEPEAQMFYEKESMYLKRVIHASWDPEKQEKYLGRCTVFSLYASFMDMAVYGDILTLQPDSKMAYIEQRGYKAGRDDNGKDIWEARASLKITPMGELAIRMEAGQIAHADLPVVVYEGDLFELGTDERGNTRAIWKSKIPRQSKRIIGSFVKISRPDGSYVTGYLLQEDIDRLAAYSKRNNRGKFANALYGQGSAEEPGAGIDSGFLKAKTIKHSFGTFPRVRLKGNNSSTDDMSMEEDIPQETNPFEASSQAEPRGDRKPTPVEIHQVYTGPVRNPSEDWSEPNATQKPQGIIAPPDEEETF